MILWIERLRAKIGLRLLMGKHIYAMQNFVDEQVSQMKCIHCGKNPYFYETVHGQTTHQKTRQSRNRHSTPKD